MILTLTVKEKQRKEFDIQVPSTQRVDDTLEVLYENGLIDDYKSNLCKVFSDRQGKWLDVTRTYEENEVYTADIMCISYVEENCG